MGIGWTRDRWSPYDVADDWERCPWWNWRTWGAGWVRWRCWHWERAAFSGYHDGKWEYQTELQRAHEVLRGECDDSL